MCLCEDHILSICLKSILFINANIISISKAITGDDAMSRELNMYILPPSPSSLYPPSSSCKLLDIYNPRFIAHSYHSKRVFSTRVARIRATVCFSQPCDRLMYLLRRARLIGDDWRTEVPPRHRVSTWTVTLLAFIAKTVSANSYKRVHYCLINNRQLEEGNETYCRYKETKSNTSTVL